MKNNKYFRYKLTFPHTGTKIYKSRSLSTAAKKCYKEMIGFNDRNNDGIFGITNIDTNDEYKFKMMNGILYKHNGLNQNGGNLDNFAAYSTLSPSNAITDVITNTSTNVTPTNASNNTPLMNTSAQISSPNKLPDMLDSSITKSITQQEDNIYEIINNISKKINEEIKPNKSNNIDIINVNPTNAPIVDNKLVVESKNLPKEEHIDIINVNPVNVPIIDKKIIFGPKDMQNEKYVDIENVSPVNAPLLNEKIISDENCNSNESNSDTESNSCAISTTSIIMEQHKIIMELLGEISKNVTVIMDNTMPSQSETIEDIIYNDDNDTNGKKNKYLQDIENPENTDCIIF